jgi:hypothetical protein
MHVPLWGSRDSLCHLFPILLVDGHPFPGFLSSMEPCVERVGRRLGGNDRSRSILHGNLGRFCCVHKFRHLVVISRWFQTDKE